MKTTKLVLLVLGTAFVLKLIMALLGAINSIPLMGNIFEVIGLFVTIKFMFNNLTVSKREETLAKIKLNLEEVGVTELLQKEVKEEIETAKAAVQFIKEMIVPEQEEEILEYVTIQQSIPERRGFGGI